MRSALNGALDFRRLLGWLRGLASVLTVFTDVLPVHCACFLLYWVLSVSCMLWMLVCRLLC